MTDRDMIRAKVEEEKVIWQHRIVFAVQMGRDFHSWFNLPPVDGIRKTENGNLSAYMKDVVMLGLQSEGLSIVPVDGSWLCRDEEDRWWVLDEKEYASLDEERHVTLFPNRQTQRQALAILAAKKIKQEIESLPFSEQEALYNEYPEFFTKEQENE